MSEMVLRIQGLEFRADADGEPRILDIELGKLAGLARPRKIRDIIKRLLEEEFFNDSEVRTTVGQTSEKGGRPGTEYWLTERGALKVIMRLDTEKAHKLVNVVLDVFIAFRNSVRDEVGSRFVNRILRLGSPSEWRRMTEVELGVSLCKLHGHDWDGRGSQPVMLSQFWAGIYKIVLGTQVYDEMKRRNPRPSKGKNHHQLLQDDAREILVDDLRTAHTLARQSRTAGEFWGRLAYHYGHSGLQLQFGL